MTFQPKDPHFADRVRASFAGQRMMQTLGVEITRLAPGEIELAMPFEAAFTQQHGFIHAGIMATVLDSACGYAAFSLMPADAAVLTVDSAGAGQGRALSVPSACGEAGPHADGLRRASFRG